MSKLEQELQSKDPASLMSLGRALNGRDPQDPEVLESYRAIGNLMLKKGEPLLAFALIDEGRRLFENDQRLRQLLGLALARCGASDLARRVLDLLDAEELRRSPAATPEETVGREETLSLLGRATRIWASRAGRAILSRRGGTGRNRCNSIWPRIRSG